MESESQKIVESPKVCILYCALVILVLLLIWWYVSCWSSSVEHLDQADQVYTAGATMRFAQELTATDQRPYETGYNYERMKLVDTSKKN